MFHTNLNIFQTKQTRGGYAQSYNRTKAKRAAAAATTEYWVLVEEIWLSDLIPPDPKFKAVAS